MHQTPRSLKFAVLLLIIAVRPVWAASGDLLDAIEYYDQHLDHYFLTAKDDEIAALDGGRFPGWERTGLSFKVLDPATAISGVLPVCRFYGNPLAGLDSHFYSASATECAQVKQRWPDIWKFESDNVFLVGLPDPVSGQCASGSVPIYRNWNGRADDNHRYTTDATVQRAMVAKGWIAEGYGSPSLPVAMCSPSGAGVVTPACTIVASSGAPLVGTNITLTALCDGNPGSYAWSGCSSTTSSCTATSASTGLRRYTVVASNASGAGAPAYADVTWVEAPPAPSCVLNVTTDSDRPVAGSLVLLTATCSNNPTSYSWSGCASTSAICLARAPGPGVVAYSVSATNAGGTGAPAGAAVSWQSSGSIPPGFCSQYSSFLYTQAAWAENAIYTSPFFDDPAFAWNGVWVVQFNVSPAALRGTFGRATVAEFNGSATSRDATISTIPCDFRATDPTGANGPLSRSTGTTTNNAFVIGSPMPGIPALQPGQTYYLNVRNWSVESNSISCPAEQRRCDALVYLVP